MAKRRARRAQPSFKLCLTPAKKLQSIADAGEIRRPGHRGIAIFKALTSFRPSTESPLPVKTLRPGWNLYAVYGSGSSGEIDFTVGSSPSASGLITTITFPTAYPSAPKAVIVANGTNLPSGFSWNTTTTTMTISCSSTMTAGTFYKLEYILVA